MRLISQSPLFPKIHQLQKIKLTSFSSYASEFSQFIDYIVPPLTNAHWCLIKARTGILSTTDWTVCPIF